MQEKQMFSTSVLQHTLANKIKRFIKVTMFLGITTMISLSPISLSQAYADGPVDMVIDKMSNGNVSTICGGGREAIGSAAMTAVEILAQAGKITTYFHAIGAKAGNAFYQAHCIHSKPGHIEKLDHTLAPLS